MHSCMGFTAGLDALENRKLTFLKFLTQLMINKDFNADTCCEQRERKKRIKRII
jgi:hypothetical protein